MMIDNTFMKNLSKDQFEEYYKTHCNLDYKMNKLLFFLIPLYQQYNDLYQDNLASLKSAKEDEIYTNRLNNLHQEIKNQQERIYTNRLLMSQCLKNNYNLDSNIKKKYSEDLIKVYQNNLDNNKNNESNIKNFNNECIEPYFDTQQRFFFNIKCNQNNNISRIPIKLNNNTSNENSDQQSNESNKKSKKYNTTHRESIIFNNKPNIFDISSNNQTLLSGNNQISLLQSDSNSPDNSGNVIYNNSNNKVSNISNRFNRIQKANLPNVNILQSNRNRSPNLKNSKKNLKIRLPNKKTKISKKIINVDNIESVNRPNNNKSSNDESNNKVNNNESNDGIDINRLDKAYLNKHNELMNVYNAYQILYNKVNKYKDDLDKVKSLSTSKLINNNTMKKMLDDQKYVMNSVDKMQDELIKKNIIKPEERVPTQPVVSHPQNMNHFNNTLKEQIEHLINNNRSLNSNIKKKLFNVINREQFVNSEFNSNDNKKNNNKSENNNININTIESR